MMPNSPTSLTPRGTAALDLALDLVALALAGAGNALLAARLNFAPVALALVAVAFVIRLAQTRLDFFKLPLLALWLLFLVSAWIGVNISFDPAFSLRKFDLILGGILLFYVIATTRTAIVRRLVAGGLVFVGAGVAVFYLTQTNFADYPTKIGLLNQIGFALHKISPQFGFHTPHPNLMAGIILLALPFAAGFAYDAARNKHTAALCISSAFTVFLAFGLVMTTSRGAVLALAMLVAVGIYGYIIRRTAKHFRLPTGTALAVAVNLVLIVLILMLVVGGSRLTDILGTVSGSVNSMPRPVLYRQVWQLGQDYAFTGAGLDTFSPNYSTYAELINVHLLPHAHDLYLQVWFEQGILGIVAFLGLIAAYYIWTIRRLSRMNWLAVAGVAATTLMLLHGLVDVLFYFSRVISLMFIPLGLTVCALEPLTSLESAQKIPRRLLFAGAAMVGIVVLIALALFLTRGEQITAQWTANTGALTQARLELPNIQFPHPTYSEFRRTADLSSAEKLFNQALARDPNNRTAHLRLGMIALDRFQFEPAVRHLEAAYNDDPSNRAAIKALGYAYVWTGKADQAEKLLRQIPEASQELDYTIGDWRALGRNDLAASAQKMIQRLKQ